MERPNNKSRNRGQHPNDVHNFSPDKVLAESPAIVISSDGQVLDECQRWYNLGKKIIEGSLPEARVVRCRKEKNYFQQ